MWGRAAAGEHPGGRSSGPMLETFYADVGVGGET
jgi:hypothetical protein